jgi:hypothetical protein
LAPWWISIVLALEIPAAQRETEGSGGDPSVDPGHEHGQPPLGRAPHPRRVAQAWHRCRPDERCKVHDQKKERAITRLEDLSLQSADGIASIDLFVVPTLSFRLLYGFLVLRHHRRQIMWLGVTASPTAEWIARQLTEACGWEPAPGYIVRDRDCAYGDDLRTAPTRDGHSRPTNCTAIAMAERYAERLIGSIRREILDHVVVLSERHCGTYCSRT